MKAGPALFLCLLAPLLFAACSDATAPEAVTEKQTDTVSEQDEMIGRGEAIAEAACASCHAIGDGETSPHPEAPPFRILGERHALGTLAEDFEDGVVTTHPDMPHWDFEQIDITALVAYLESVQAGGAE